MTDHHVEAVIARLRELDAKATPRPWKQTNHVREPNLITSLTYVAEQHIVCHVFDSKPNAALISEYRNVVPQLLDEIERLKARLATEAQDDD